MPPKRNMTEHWEYDKERYKERNVVERLFFKHSFIFIAIITQNIINDVLAF